MISTLNDLPQTEARIDVQEWNEEAKEGDRGLFRITNTVGFTYVNDVLNLGDPFSFTLPNPDGSMLSHFQRGAKMRLFLSNKAVNDGAPTLKHMGIVVERSPHGDRSGNYIDVQGADLGWHLLNNDGPYWFKLQGYQFNVRLENLLTNPKFIDASWGINTDFIAGTNTTTREIRQGLNGGRAQAQFAASPTPTWVYIQIEPGDKIADIVLPYARRANLLFTVSPDGYMQLWRPDYNQKPLYEINLRKQDDPDRNKGNVISYRITENIGTIYSDVTCIGEYMGNDLKPNPKDQNALKRDYVGVYKANTADVQVLPFVHRKVFADGDIFQQQFAKKQAAWAWKRGMFDAWSASYVLKGHHSNGRWWEADTMVQVRDTINGLDGNFYISAVTYTRDAQRGDVTQVTLRKPGLLAAAGGVYPRYSVKAAPKSVIYVELETTSTIEAKAAN